MFAIIVIEVMGGIKMEIKLDPMQGYVTKNRLFDQAKALESTGVKAAICYKEVKEGVPVSQDNIREDKPSIY